MCYTFLFNSAKYVDYLLLNKCYIKDLNFMDLDKRGKIASLRAERERILHFSKNPHSPENQKRLAEINEELNKLGSY